MRKASYKMLRTPGPFLVLTEHELEPNNAPRLHFLFFIAQCTLEGSLVCIWCINIT